MNENKGDVDPVEIATRVRSSLPDRSQAEIDIAVQEALRAFRNGATAEESVQTGCQALDGADPG